MGLLDDAIREHLDLKRRRGADPAEIARLEREALGPVRRGPKADVPEVAEEDDVAYDEELEPEWDEDFEEPSHSAPPPPAAERAELDESPARDKPLDPEPPRESEQPPAHRVAARPPATEPASPDLEDETAEYDVVAEHESGDGEDVLEETPEFLQDTPDHDRLWFEQRPPRDFDFDG